MSLYLNAKYNIIHKQIRYLPTPKKLYTQCIKKSRNQWPEDILFWLILLQNIFKRNMENLINVLKYELVFIWYPKLSYSSMLSLPKPPSNL